MDERQNLILGDIHGRFSVITTYLNRGVLDSANLFQIGDFGIGFECKERDLETLDYIDEELSLHDTNLVIIRGNHDDPSYWLDYDFRDKMNARFANIEFVGDYEEKTIDGKKILFIGGAVSVDRELRQKAEKENNRKLWWEAERLQPPPEDLGHADIIIAHTCPSFFNIPTIDEDLEKWFEQDSELKEDLLYERKLMDSIFERVKPERFYSGHFHNSMTGEHEGCKYRSIDINELYKLDI